MHAKAPDGEWMRKDSPMMPMSQRNVLTALGCLMLVTWAHDTPAHAEDVLVIRAKPLIVQRVKPNVGRVRATRKPDPQPVGSTAAATVSQSTEALPLPEAHSVSTGAATHAVTVVATEEDLLAAPGRDLSDEELGAAQRRPYGAINRRSSVIVAPDVRYVHTVQRYVVPSYSVHVGHSYGHAPSYRTYDHGYYYRYGANAYRCRSNGWYGHSGHHAHGNFGIGFHFRF